MKNLTAFTFLILLGACATIPKDHFGIVVDKETEQKIVRFSADRKVLVSSNEVIKAVSFNQSQPLEMEFLSKDGEAMFINCMYKLQINPKTLEKLVSTIEYYDGEIDTRIETLLKTEMRAWTRNTLGGITKSEMTTEVVKERLFSKDYNPGSDLIKLTGIEILEIK